jgi:hypothetical protein
MSTSKTGKHGHAKVNLVAIDVSLVSPSRPHQKAYGRGVLLVLVLDQSGRSFERERKADLDGL